MTFTSSTFNSQRGTAPICLSAAGACRSPEGLLACLGFYCFRSPSADIMSVPSVAGCVPQPFSALEARVPQAVQSCPLPSQLPHPLSLLQPTTLGDHDLPLVSFFRPRSWPDPSKSDAGSSYTRSHLSAPPGWLDSELSTHWASH